MKSAPIPSKLLRSALPAVVLLACMTAMAPTAPAQSGPVPQTVGQATLHLDNIELAGATRTRMPTVLLHLPLTPGQPIDQATLVAAVAELRRSELFADVSFYTRPGSERGHLTLVLEVREHRLDFRWAAGNTDLDGWYLVPAMVAWDNVSGHGDFLDFQWRVGFRHTGLLLNYGRPWANKGRDYWGARLSSITTDRPYFSDGVEYRHQVGTSGLAGVYGRRFSKRWLGELGLNLEGVDAADHSTAHTGSADGGVAEGDEVRGDDLPEGISSGLGKDGRVILHADLQHDTRAWAHGSGTPVSGLWGRLKTELTLQEERSHVGLQADLRAYRRAPAGVLALRLRGAAVTKDAAFYDRLYLGGMYTVRGFPTHSLSAPGGDTWLWSGSVEHRSRILGDAKGTRLAGVLFLDAGASGTFDTDAFSGVAAGAGYGLRMRIWWLDWIGIDVGFPLTARPVDQRFQLNASIGWSF